ncbi:selenocysteine-specific translation elongation factor [Chloroflexota bacterium]
MYVIGTAGHVDHGKSTLVRALTGIDPDRLREEKEREMTIDLGFAWITLPGDLSVGIVDVPGHRDFIENMLAGVGGIDTSLFVIAADEGVMPQTREHLAILDLLEVPGGVIVMTKIDMVDDPEWLDLVELEIQDVMQGTVLEDAPIVRISARDGLGLAELQQVLADHLASCTVRVDQGHPRLPIDRVFSMSGFGTVVTGTLAGGSLAVGDAVEIQPGELAGRVRGLQAYKQKLERVQPGNRVAVNITGVERHDIQRGQVLTQPDWLRSTMLLDVRFRHLPDASRPLKHNAQVKFFSGAAESLARVRLLDVDELQPGAEGWLQIQLSEPVALVRGDRFILRYPSPAETIGGGLVIDPGPGRRWRRKRPEVLARLETLSQGTPGELIAQTLERGRAPVRLKDLQQQSNMVRDELQAALQEALAAGLVRDLGGGWWISATIYQALLRDLEQLLQTYHQAEPLRLGMPREELRSRLQIGRGVFDRVLDQVLDLVVSEAEVVRLQGHAVVLTAGQQAVVDDLLAAFARQPYQPPSVKEASEQAGADLFRYLVERGDLVLVSQDVVLTAAVYDEFFGAVAGHLDEHGSISARELRDVFGTTRKYAIGFLEHLDAQGITRRDGDVRVWLRRP